MTINWNEVETVKSGEFKPLPAGTLVWAKVNLQPDNDGNYIRTYSNGNKAYSIEYELLGKYAGKKVFDNMTVSGFFVTKKGVKTHWDAIAQSVIKTMMITSGRDLSQINSLTQPNLPQIINGCVVGAVLKIDTYEKDGETKEVNKISYFLDISKDDKGNYTNKKYLQLIAEQGEAPVIPQTVNVMASSSIDSDEIPF